MEGKEAEKLSEKISEKSQIFSEKRLTNHKRRANICKLSREGTPSGKIQRSAVCGTSED